jgi:PleD family two-component response regulator
MKQIRKVSKIPVIVFSNYDDSKTREEAKQLGVEDYLIKTEFTPNQLLIRIKKYFKNHIK